MTSYRDSSGRTLGEYPRPSVAVDTAVLTVHAERLCVLLVDDDGQRLPGTFLHEGERLADAVRRSLETKAGIRGLRPQQLRVFDDPQRDERGWVLSVAHVDVVPGATLPEAGRFRVAPAEAVRGLPFDHDAIVVAAVDHLRGRYLERPDPELLLGDSFTLRELQLLHEAVAGRAFVRDTFRRTMQRMLVETGERTSGAVGKPARRWRRAG